MNGKGKRLVCLIVSIVMILGFAFILVMRNRDPLERILSKMTLRDKAAQMMIASFRVWKEVPENEGEEQTEEAPSVKITELNDEIRELLGRTHFGGILLFGENF